MDDAPAPTVLPGNGALRSVHGTFDRAVGPAFADRALTGSRSSSDLSWPDAPALYLSASREGVAAAMIAHRDERSPQLSILAVEVEATGIVDLRDHAELARLGIDPADAAAKWQADASAGRTPPSWGVRSALEDQGARGLIDPSRRRPGLWHLTLFAWNRPGAPTGRPPPEQTTRPRRRRTPRPAAPRPPGAYVRRSRIRAPAV